MNSSTGEIKRFVDMTPDEKQRFDIPLTDAEARLLSALPADVRVEELRKLRNPANPRTR